MIIVTVNTLDTCVPNIITCHGTCTRIFWWDDQVPEDKRIETHLLATPNGIPAVVCDYHQKLYGTKDPLIAHPQVVIENKARQFILVDIRDSNPKLYDVITDPDTGKTFNRWKDGLEPLAPFDDNRNLIIDIPILDSNEKTSIDSLVKQKYSQPVIIV